MEGELKGKTLESIPSTMTDWVTWRRLHPETSAVNLSRTSEEFRRDFYRDADRFVLGFTEHGANPKAWSFQKLADQPVVNDTVGDTPLVVVFDEASKTALAFDRRLAGQTLTFERRGAELVDGETETMWDPLTGQALAGKLRGRSLRPLPAIVSFTAAWVTFHPDTAGLSPAEIEKAKNQRSRGNARPRQSSARQRREQTERRKRLRHAVALMKQHDADADGRLSREERAGVALPDTVDQNHDDIVTFKELVDSLKDRLD